MKTVTPGVQSRRPTTSSGPGSCRGESLSQNQASTMAISPKGMLIQKMYSQLKFWISQPATVGPSAGASSMGTPMVPIIRPRSWGGVMCISIDIPTGITMPPARPWRTRNAISVCTLRANPQSKDATTKTSSVAR